MHTCLRIHEKEEEPDYDPENVLIPEQHERSNIDAKEILPWN